MGWDYGMELWDGIMGWRRVVGSPDQPGKHQVKMSRINHLGINNQERGLVPFDHLLIPID